MIIQTKLSKKDFINANLTLKYSSVFLKIMFILGITVLILVIIFLVLFPEYFSMAFVIPPVFMSLLPFSLHYYSAASFFEKNPKEGEKMAYVFDKDDFAIKGESFQSEFKWTAIKKVKTIMSWLFIFHKNGIINPIPKASLFDSEIQELKELLENNRVNNNL